LVGTLPMARDVKIMQAIAEGKSAETIMEEAQAEGNDEQGHDS